MTGGWISPWNGNKLSADELIDEVALAAVSRLYILSELGFPDHQLSIETDSIVVMSSTVDYSFVIYYPSELYETVKGYFLDCLLSLKREYGIEVDADNLKRPSGEKMGEMLRYFDTLDRLVRMVSARNCWNQKKILAVHGIRSSESMSKIRGDFEQASIRYLVMSPLGENPGCGFFKTIELDAAELVVKDIGNGQEAVVERLFDLEYEYGPHAMISNDENLAI